MIGDWPQVEEPLLLVLGRGMGGDQSKKVETQISFLAT